MCCFAYHPIYGIFVSIQAESILKRVYINVGLRTNQEKNQLLEQVAHVLTTQLDSLRILGPIPRASMRIETGTVQPSGTEDETDP